MGFFRFGMLCEVWCFKVSVVKYVLMVFDVLIECLVSVLVDIIWVFFVKICFINFDLEIFLVIVLVLCVLMYFIFCGVNLVWESVERIVFLVCFVFGFGCMRFMLLKDFVVLESE